MLGVFWILHTCINELGQTEYCTSCGYYDPNLINDSDNETEHQNGRKRKEGGRNSVEIASDAEMLQTSQPASMRH